MQSIFSVIMECPFCHWKGKVKDCKPDVDGEGSLGCPKCNRVVVEKAFPQKPIPPGVRLIKGNEAPSDSGELRNKTVPEIIEMAKVVEKAMLHPVMTSERMELISEIVAHAKDIIKVATAESVRHKVSGIVNLLERLSEEDAATEVRKCFDEEWGGSV